jgi:hypothetical protein
MQSEIFSRNYVKCYQNLFERALEEGQLEDALEILESFPQGTNLTERWDRAVVLKEGYRAIAEAAINEGVKELGTYRSLGELDELRRIVDEHRNVSRVIND